MAPKATPKSDPGHPVARLLRAARLYSGKSRAQVAKAVGVNPGTIGRWERGQWEKDPPKFGLVKAALDETEADALAKAIIDMRGPGAAKRFSDRTREASQRPRGRPGSGLETRGDQDELGS